MSSVQSGCRDRGETLFVRYRIGRQQAVNHLAAAPGFERFGRYKRPHIERRHQAPQKLDVIGLARKLPSLPRFSHVRPWSSEQTRLEGLPGRYDVRELQRT